MATDGFWLTPAGVYYQGDQASLLDIAVPQRPDHKHIFVDGAWVPTPATTDDVDTLRDARLAAGFVDTGNTGKTFQCDDSSLIKWGGIGASAGISVLMQLAPPITVWGTDNEPLALTAQQAFALFNGRLLPWVSATMAHARDLKNLILAGTPPADITLGWP